MWGVFPEELHQAVVDRNSRLCCCGGVAVPLTLERLCIMVPYELLVFPDDAIPKAIVTIGAARRIAMDEANVDSDVDSCLRLISTNLA